MEFAPVGSAQFSEADLAKCIINDVQEVFSTMVGIDDLLNLPLVINPVTRLENCVTAMVGLAGSYNGVVCLHAPECLALNFTSGMLGMEVNKVDDEVHDALGEIVNMIAGSIKHQLSRGGTDIRLSIPSVITGKDYFFSVGKPDDMLMLGFATNQKWFMVSTALKKAMA